MIRRAALHVLVIAATLACHGDARSGPPPATPTRSEFLLLAGDSTFWVKTGAQPAKLRGSAIQIARYGGHFYEIYVADDDRSFPAASIIGQRLYRRDLLTGDSLLVFEDTVVAGIAHRYARTHPDERPLGPEEEPDDEPEFSATSELSVRAHHGRFLSYEYRLEQGADSVDPSITVRRGALDLESGEPATLASMFGDTAAARIVREGKALFSQTLDSVMASHDRRAASAVRALADFAFDRASFALTDVDRGPAVQFVVVGRGPAAGGKLLTLPPIRVAPPAWWADVSDALPVLRAGDETPTWRQGAYDVAAHESPGGEWAELTLIDRDAHRWELGRVPTPVWRIFWLDTPAVDSASLRALSHAFDEAVLYSEDARTASLGAPSRARGFALAAARSRSAPRARPHD